MMPPAESTLVIRQMQPDDLQAVHEIDQLSFPAPWSLESYRYELNENPAARLLVAEQSDSAENSRVIGVLVAWLVVNELHIASIAIHPAHRRQGIARKLLTRSLIAAIQEGVQISHLEVRRSNLAAQALYRSLGFELVGERRGYYSPNREDALLFSLHGLGKYHLIWRENRQKG